MRRYGSLISINPSDQIQGEQKRQNVTRNFSANLGMYRYWMWDFVNSYTMMNIDHMIVVK